MSTESTSLLSEVLNLVSSTALIGVLYGIASALYCFCAWPLFLQLREPSKRRRAGFSLGYISLLFSCLTAFLVLNARMIQPAFIIEANFPGGPMAYEESFNSTVNAYITAAGVLSLTIEVSTMAIQIRRLWIIWNGTRYSVAVTILPVLLLLSYIALDMPANIIDVFVPLDQLGISSKSGAAMITAEFAVLSGFTIIVTALIAMRLLLARRQHMKIMGMSEAPSPYLSIVAMLVESYALDSGWSLAAAISFALSSSSEIMFATNDPTIKVIAYFLVVYRVETGRGWTKQTKEKLTTLQWNHGAQTVTDDVTGIRSPAPPTTSVRAVDSLHIIHSYSAA